MRRLVPLVLVLLSLSSPAFAIPVTVIDLEREPEAWRNIEVTVSGELVGDYGVRREVVWVQLNDDAYTWQPLLESGELEGGNVGIGVRMTHDQFDPDSWGDPGGYKTRGPIVEVTGTFRSGGPEEAGDTFIEATEVSLRQHARPIGAGPPATLQAMVGAIALAIGGAAVAYARWKRVHPEVA